MRSKDDLVPEIAGFSNHGDTIHTAWGLTTSGVAMFNGISGEETDPFYPKAYGRCTTAADCVEMVDTCFSHPENTGFMHYHVASPCQGNPAYDDNGVTGLRDNDVIETLKSAWLASHPYRDVVGLSKDGRPIYTPYYDNGKSYEDCDVDVCNGYWLDGNYVYVSTWFHPYVQGCYGPGNYPNFTQSCSTNGRKCSVGSGSVALGLSMAVALASSILSV